MELALGCTYPLAHAEDVKNRVVEKLRLLEKLEIAIQGDDYADKEHLLAETVVHVSSPSQRKA